MMLRLRGAFQTSAKVLKANGRSKLLVYPGVIIGVSAAAAVAMWKANDYFIKYQALKKEEEEELKLKAFRNEELRKLGKAVLDCELSEDGDDYPIVFPPINGRTISQMVSDFEEEEMKKFPEKAAEYHKFSPSERCEMIWKLLKSDCGATEVEQTAEEDENLPQMAEQYVNLSQMTTEEYEKYIDDLRWGIQAKLRGMNTAEFIDYARRERENCKEMCAKCKKVPLPPGCEQDIVDRFCNR